MRIWLTWHQIILHYISDSFRYRELLPMDPTRSTNMLRHHFLRNCRKIRSTILQNMWMWTNTSYRYVK